MLLDLKPLVRFREYRFLFFGQLISFFGSMITYVALPYQIYHLTRSSLDVGLVGIVQLVPLLFTALLGGAFADAMDRRKLLIFAELSLATCSLVFALNSLSAHPRIWLIYLIAGVASGINGFHRPALNSMIPRLVPRHEVPAVSALNSFKSTIGQVGGPALGGILIAIYGLPLTYGADVLSFLLSLALLARMSAMPAKGQTKRPGLSSIIEGMKYAQSRQELVGTYLVDIVAMVFGMPMALFPAVAEGLGGARALGWLYSAPSVGALLASIFSAWTKRVRSHGLAVLVAAGVWGAAITAFGFSHTIWISLALLAVAGGADMVSVIFRKTIWDGTIPDSLRGRLAGLEMLSYMSGPLLGNAESGLVAALATTQASIVSGGLLCMVGVIACAVKLPRFREYDSESWLIANESQGIPAS